ncbi:hypothetical protein JCM8547_004929 [Rhodosporidiobolus lusitaniae]
MTLPPPAQPVGPSPLKQLNQTGAPPPRSKLEASWDELSSNPSLFSAPDAPSPARYFAEFFCLKPQRKLQEAALAKLSVQELTGPYKENISHLFVNAVRVLKESERSDVSRLNVIDTLIPFLRDVLSREYDNRSFTIRTLLASSLEQGDKVFSDLVSTIDTTLQDRIAPLHLRHRILQLALVIVASVDQDSLNAYFLRRDLFSTLVSFIGNEDTKQFAFESALLLGLLANFRKSEARNPYGVRIEDFVEEGVMTRIIEVVETVCVSSRDAYLAIADDTAPTFVSSLTAFLTSFRITELLSSPLSLPSPPPPPAPPVLIPSTAPPSSPDKGKQKAEDPSPPPPASEPAEPGRSASSNSSSSTPAPAASSSPEKPTPSTSSPSTSSPSRPGMNREVSTRPEDVPFVSMPPDRLAILLPFYEFLNANKTFGSLVFSAREDGKAPALPFALISLSSYVVSHASLSSRAQLYSRLCLIIMLILVEEGEGKLASESSEGGEEEVRLCRQRQPVLPRTLSKRPIAAMIDTVVLYLRHNLRKRLDVETHIVALRLLQRILQQLKTEKVRSEHDWVIVWRSILALARFIVGRIAELRKLSEKVDTLISQVFITLCYATYWADSILPDSSAQSHLYYELLHADETLSSLSDLLGISSIASPVFNHQSSVSSSTGLPSFNRRDTATRTSFFSPTRSSFGSLAPPTPTSLLSPAGAPSYGSGTGGGFVATECISSLRSATTHFTSCINQYKLSRIGKTDDEPEPGEILSVIEKNLGGVEMIESAAMGDLRRFATEGSVGMESYFKELTRVVGEDTLRLLEENGAAGK